MGYREVAADSGYLEWDDYADLADDEPERFDPPIPCGRCGRAISHAADLFTGDEGVRICSACDLALLREWEAERARGHADGSGEPPF